MGATIERFPLFPLGLVLLPGETVPLHIFEERYKLMIDECLADDHEFGIVWLGDEGLRETGCAARVTRVLERMDDGRMNILIEGTTPFALRRRIEELPYPAGDIEVLEDDADDGSSDGEVGAEARRRFADLVERATDERPADQEVAELGAYALASRLEFALEAKQDLLELRSERGRMERLAELFDATMQRLELTERASERARSNGHVSI
jgi:Lon protease-like protein